MTDLINRIKSAQVIAGENAVMQDLAKKGSINSEKKEIPPVKELRVCWVPQLPMEPFVIPVTSELEADKVMNLLADYDLFQLNKRIKPDFSNAGWVEELNEDGIWESWCDIENGLEWGEYMVGYREYLIASGDKIVLGL